MDIITKSSGLQHIAEEIFLNLDYEKLLLCQKVNEFWKEKLNSALFWLKKWVQNGLSAQHTLEWSKLIKQPMRPRAQSFSSLMADLCQDINRVSSYSRAFNGTFP